MTIYEMVCAKCSHPMVTYHHTIIKTNTMHITHNVCEKCEQSYIICECGDVCGDYDEYDAPTITSIIPIG